MMNPKDLLEVAWGYYDDEGRRITNFKIRLLKKFQLYKDGKMQDLYRIAVIFEHGEQIEMEVSAQELNLGKWLDRFPVARYVSDSKRVSSYIQRQYTKAFATAPYRGVITDRIGMQCLKHHWYYITEGGSVTKDGIDWEVYTAAEERRKSIWKSILKQWKEENSTVVCVELCRWMLEAGAPMYLTFLAAVMAINCYPLQQMGISASLTFWLGGTSGSGKTELSKNMTGLAVYGQECGVLVSATGKIKDLVRTMERNYGRILILDDVKKEKVQRQREKCRTAVDIVIRSIFQRFLTESNASEETDVFTCAIVTGEYMENAESQNARLIYIEAKNFLEKPANSRALQQVQDFPECVVYTLLSYTQWICGLLESEEKKERVMQRYKRMRKEAREQNTGKNAMRLADTQAALLLGNSLFLDFLEKMGVDIRKCVRFTLSIQNAMKDTSLLVSGYTSVLENVVLEILEETLEKQKLRIAEYKVSYGDRLVEEEFYLQEENLLYIRDLKATFSDEKIAAKVKRQSEALIAKRDWFVEELEEKIEKLCVEGQLPHWFRNKVTLSLLASERIIVGKKRLEYGYRQSCVYPFIIDSEIGCRVDIREIPHYSEEGICAIRLDLSCKAFAEFRMRLRERSCTEIKKQFEWEYRGCNICPQSREQAQKARLHFFSELSERQIS